MVIQCDAINCTQLFRFNDNKCVSKLFILCYFSNGRKQAYCLDQGYTINQTIQQKLLII